MRRELVLSAAIAVMLVAPASGAVEQAKPRLRPPAGATIGVLGTNIACLIPDVGRSISCHRFKGSNRKTYVPGGYSALLKADGDVVVTRREGTVWNLAFGRYPASAGSGQAERPLILVRLNDEFQVPGSQIVCQVSAFVLSQRKRLGGQAMQCGFADAKGRLGVPQSYGFLFAQTGRLKVVRFGASRRPREIFDSKRTAARTVKVGIETNIFVASSGSRRLLTCGGVVFRGGKALACSTLRQGPLPDDYAFVIAEDGTIGVFRNDGPTPTRVAGVEGRDLRWRGRDEQPSAGDSVVLPSGDYFKLAGTAIVCATQDSGTNTVVHCGIGDREGVGTPRTHSVALRADGRALLIRWDKRRQPKVIYASW